MSSVVDSLTLCEQGARVIAFTLIKFSDSLSAGFPSAAEGYEDEPLNLQTFLVRNPAATFFFRVSGDVLRDEFIRDGSLLVVDRSITPSRGQLVVAEDGSDFIVVRYRIPFLNVVIGVVTAAIMRV